MKTLATKIPMSCIATLGVAAFLFAIMSGCTKLESGAHAEPSVRLKPADDVVASANAGGNSPAGESVSASGGVGKVVGIVKLSGSKPSQKVLIRKGTSQKDGTVCAADGDVLNEELVIGGDNGIANVFVYLDKAPAGVKIEKPAGIMGFDQKGCVFTTHAVICQVGQTINVLSDDDIAHNTHTFPARNDPFNSTIKPKERAGIPLTYKKSEKNPFQVKCDLHAWMLAYHLPLDHPFGAVSGKDGTFEIANLPSGKHEFRVWHERAEGGKGGFLNRKLVVQVKPGDPTEVTVEAKAGDFGL